MRPAIGDCGHAGDLFSTPLLAVRCLITQGDETLSLRLNLFALQTCTAKSRSHELFLRSLAQCRVAVLGGRLVDVANRCLLN